MNVLLRSRCQGAVEPPGGGRSEGEGVRVARVVHKAEVPRPARQVVAHGITSLYTTSLYITSVYTRLHYMTSVYTTLLYTASLYITSVYTTLLYTASLYITSVYTKLLYTTSLTTILPCIYLHHYTLAYSILHNFT